VAQLQPSKFFLLFLAAVSVFGLALIPLFLLQPHFDDVEFWDRRVIVGTLYSVVCVGGIVAVFHPARCRMLFKKTENPLPTGKPSTLPMQFKGHHPDCHKFSGNRIRIGGAVVCSACSGLLVGGVIALAGTLLYFFGGVSLIEGHLWVLGLGEVLMVIGLAQIWLGGYVKMVVNALFVVGSFLTLIVVDGLGQSLLVDLYVVGMIVFLLWTRILFSEWNNKKICVECGRCS
jgi:hypothetical protein